MDGGIFVWAVFALLTVIWIGLVASEIYQICKMRGHRCKESDALELALKVKILFAIGVVISGFIESPTLLGICFFGECGASLLGIVRSIQLADAMNNGL
jgi:nitric oxide reductase large subunit